MFPVSCALGQPPRRDSNSAQLMSTAPTATIMCFHGGAHPYLPGCTKFIPHMDGKSLEGTLLWAAQAEALGPCRSGRYSAPRKTRPSRKAPPPPSHSSGPMYCVIISCLPLPQETLHKGQSHYAGDGEGRGLGARGPRVPQQASSAQSGFQPVRTARYLRLRFLCF